MPVRAAHTSFLTGTSIAGTRARKTHTKSFDAFSSIDFPDIGVFYDKKLLCYIDERPECPGAVFYDKLVPEILSIRVIPGMDPSVFDYITAHCRGVVIESFGVGGIPYYGDNAFEEKIAALMENGVRVVITIAGSARGQQPFRLPRGPYHQGKVPRARSFQHDNGSRHRQNDVGTGLFRDPRGI